MHESRRELSPGPLIRCRGLDRGFASGHGRLAVLRGLDLEVQAGEMVAVVGESGVGKSTLLHLLAGLDGADHGEIGIGGQILSDMDARQRSVFRNRSIGIVFQFHHLLPEFTARENVLLPAWMGRADRAVAGGRADALLRRLGLTARADHRPSQLSGGEQQRVAIARALVNEPMLLLADEPTGNLDADNAAGVFDSIRSLNRERRLTVVLATHNLRFAHRCDRVLRLQGGRLQPETMTPAEVDPGRPVKAVRE